jgi:cell wall-associated NlpC family hydrolase
MKKVVRVMFFMLLLAALWIENRISAKAQADSAPKVISNLNFSLYVPELPLTPGRRRTVSSVPTNFREENLPPAPMLNTRSSKLLHAAIKKRIGIPYRFYGVDDRGYDCSGFVWRVFQDAGAKFTRTRVRELWKQLPDAVGPERSQFGTLVFFKGLKHVGIVRDANSFYHSSRSKGVILSSFDGYWGKRIKGFRRAPSSILAEPINSGN